MSSEPGALLRRRREHLGLTQEELGAKLSPPVSFAAVSSWESGAKKIPKKRVAELARVLGVDFSRAARYATSTERRAYALAVADSGVSLEAIATAVRLTLDERLTVDRGARLEYVGSLDRIARASPNLTIEIVEAAVDELVDAGLVELASDARWHLAFRFPKDSDDA